MPYRYPLFLNVRPLNHWPTTLTANRKVSRFRAPWGTTTKDLRRELGHLAPRGYEQAPVVLEVAAGESQLRKDRTGLLSGQVPEHPGVILNVESAHGRLSYPCDTFLSWEDNVRAIALTLRAIRQTEQYGVGTSAQFYTGFAQLGAGTGVAVISDDAGDRTESTAGLVYELDNITVQWTPGSMRTPDGLGDSAAVHRRARAATHPDRAVPGESTWRRREAWDRVEAIGNELRRRGEIT